MSRIRFALISSGAIAPQNELAVYAKSNRKLYTMDQDGTETQLLTSTDKVLKFQTDLVTVTVENMTNGYLDLNYEADGSFFMMVRSRVVYLLNDGLTIEEVDGVSRVHFGDEIKSGGDESLEPGENLIFVYTT